MNWKRDYKPATKVDPGQGGRFWVSDGAREFVVEIAPGTPMVMSMLRMAQSSGDLCAPAYFAPCADEGVRLAARIGFKAEPAAIQ